MQLCNELFSVLMLAEQEMVAGGKDGCSRMGWALPAVLQTWGFHLEVGAEIRNTSWAGSGSQPVIANVILMAFPK